jgi:hypothetical protein
MTGNPSVTRVFKRVDARDVLLVIRANPGVSRHDLHRDFGFRAPLIAGGLAKLGLVELRRGARGQTYWPLAQNEKSSFGPHRDSDGEGMKTLSKDNGSVKTETARMPLLETNPDDSTRCSFNARRFCAMPPADTKKRSASLGFADPPYEPTRSGASMLQRHYAHDAHLGEVELAPLIRRLDDEYDGWAVCMHDDSAVRLKEEDMPVGAFLCSWVKPFAPFKMNVTLARTWEPVIIKPARWPSRKEPTVRNWVAASCTLKKGLAGAKPEAFTHWALSFMGASEGDTFSDLFPGTGACTRAWETFFDPAHDRRRWPFIGGTRPHGMKEVPPYSVPPTISAPVARAFRSVFA